MDAQTTAYVKDQIAFEYERFTHNQPPPDDSPQLPDIPADRYVDDEFFALEQEHLWSKTWLLAGHADEVPDVGSYKLWESAGAPILIVRGRDRQIRAFYNTCSHRGSSLVRQESGKEVVFVCTFHCWAYNLDGSLNHIPDEREFIAIDKSKRGLKPVRCEMFGNWIYINCDVQAVPLTEFLGPLTHELEDFRPDELRFVSRYHYDLPCNWKITMEAFMEAYHIKEVHPKTVNRIMDNRVASIALLPQGSTRMFVPAKTGESRFVPVPAANKHEAGDRHEVVRSGTLSYNMFPNIVTPIGAYEFPLLQIWPTSRNTSRYEVTWFGRGEILDRDSDYWRRKIAQFNVVLDEDNNNLPWIQRSIESGALRGVPLSYKERCIYHFHEHLDRVIGEDRIRPELRAEQVLGPYQEDGKGRRVGACSAPTDAERNIS